MPPESVEFSVAPDHPALPGHFPDNPIVPGVMILDRALAPIYLEYPGGLIEVVQAKFNSPLKPGEACRIDFTVDRSGNLRFECRSGERLVAGGLVRMERLP